MMKKIIALLLLIPAFAGLSGQSLKVDDKSYRWEGSLYAGLNTDGYEVDGGVSFFINRFVGVRCGVGVAGEIGSLSNLSIVFDYDDPILPGNDYDYYYNDHSSLTRMRFTPALVLRSPCLYEWREQDVQIYLFGEPGLVFSTPEHDSHGARWFNLMLRAGLNMQVDRWVFTIGYGITDYSLTSGLKQFKQPNHITHTGFIGAGYKF